MFFASKFITSTANKSNNTLVEGFIGLMRVKCQVLFGIQPSTFFYGRVNLETNEN